MKTYKKGISLIVLVITVIVLSILATTVIISLSNTNIISQTNSAVFKSDMANLKSAYELYVASELIKDVSFNVTTLNVTSSDAEFTKIFGDNVSEKYTAGLKIVDGKLVYDTDSPNELVVLIELGMVEKPPIEIPEGFTMSVYAGERSIEDGLVIYKTDAKTLATYSQEEAQKTFDQFVWVPVEYTKTNTDTDSNGTDDGFDAVFKRTDWSNNAPTGSIAAGYTEPYASGYSTEKAEYDAMRKSVEHYGGFYIGRYEAGDGDAKEARSTYTTGAHTVVLRKQAYIYNYVGWGKNMKDVTSDVSSEKGKGAVYLSSNMYGTNASYTTHLIYGVQWDATLKWLSDKYNVSDGRTWGNCSNSEGAAATNSGSGNMNYTTGRNEAWKAKNIYDLAGNVNEWTLEAVSTSLRVVRSGTVNSSNCNASSRGMYEPNIPDLNLGFRPVLYINL